MDIEKLKPQVMALGKIYRVLQDETVSPAAINMANMRPMRGYTERMLKMQRIGKITPKMDRQLTELTALIDIDDWIDIMDVVIPYELQAIWQIGYHTGPDDSKIATMRKGKKMTQIDLADAMGVTQKDVSRWESGKVKPTADTLLKISKVLDCKIDDLI